jgi:hypothetical protein
MLCALCEKPIRGAKRGVPLWGGSTVRKTYVCERCWNNNLNISELIMAKKAVSKKPNKGKDADGRKWPSVQPCTKCGRSDFENDFKRRGHQGKCQGKNPPPALVKLKKVPIKAKVSPETVKALAGLPPVIMKSPNQTGEMPDGVKELDEKAAKKRTPSQVGRGSKQKGNNFENDIKKALAKWWGEPPEVVGSKDSTFQRSPGSGGTSPKNWPLDLYVPEDFPWAVECKNREGDAGLEIMERFLTSPTYPVLIWFTEAEAELATAEIRKPALLVFTRNRFPVFAAIRLPGAGVDMLIPPFNHLVFTQYPNLQLLVTKFDDLLSLSPDWWKAVYSTYDPNSYIPRR